MIASPFGRLGIRLAGGRLAAIDFVSARVALRAPVSAAASRACRELRRYARDGGYRPRLPLARQGTAFQRRVWRALQRIPGGTVASYGELARRLATAPRAVGAACRANPVPIVVPCHRVVAKQGLGGFMGRRRGAPLDRKRRLLAHETGR